MIDPTAMTSLAELSGNVGFGLVTIGRKLNAALAKWNERLEATWSLTDPLLSLIHI